MQLYEFDYLYQAFERALATHALQERYRFSSVSCKSWEPLTALHSPAVPSTTLDSLEKTQKRTDFAAAQVDTNPRLSTSTACCHPPDICCLTRTSRLVWLTVVCTLMVLQATYLTPAFCADLFTEKSLENVSRDPEKAMRALLRACTQRGGLSCFGVD